MRIQGSKATNTPDHDTNDGVHPVRRMMATAVVIGLAFTGLSACSSSGSDNPVSESDTGEVVEDAPFDDGADDGLGEDSVDEDGVVEGEEGS